MITSDTTILVTGAAGFIGSCMVRWLNDNGYDNLILVDDFNRADKAPNLNGKRFREQVHRDALFDWLYQQRPHMGYVIHLGARTDTTEFDYKVHQHLNVEFTQKLWQYCTITHTPLIYASSAATYGNGALGYKDDHELVFSLQPLNPYGVSKNEVDKWVLHQDAHPPFWAGLKFFNVYGPNEYHKGRMASVIYHAFRQINETGQVKLFRSHRPDFKDGEQLRDFIYVKDVVAVMGWMMQQSAAGINGPADGTGLQQQTEAGASAALQSGLYNLGTGKARTFYDLAAGTFRAMGREPNIVFIDMPEDIRDKYQYFTEADMSKLRQAGYTAPFTSLEAGINDYVQQYLLPGAFM
ncbi:MAG: ADP-glyceromanno-heptose 6-epimerase [Lacibacter sp.]